MTYDWKDLAPKMVGNWENAIFALTGENLHNYKPKQHYSCPICGGKDRFRYDNRKPKARAPDGSGGYFCNGCGSGDGMQLYQRIAGINFSEAVNNLGQFLNAQPVEQRRKAVKQIESAPRLDYGKEKTPEECGAFMQTAENVTRCPITMMSGIGPDEIWIKYRNGFGINDMWREPDSYRWANPMHRVMSNCEQGDLCNVAMVADNLTVGFLAGSVSYLAATFIKGNEKIVLCERIDDGWHTFHQTGATVLICYNPMNIGKIGSYLSGKVSGIVARSTDFDTMTYAEEVDALIWAIKGGKVTARASASKILNKLYPEGYTA